MLRWGACSSCEANDGTANILTVTRGDQQHAADDARNARA